MYRRIGVSSRWGLLNRQLEDLRRARETPPPAPLQPHVRLRRRHPPMMLIGPRKTRLFDLSADFHPALGWGEALRKCAQHLGHPRVDAVAHDVTISSWQHGRGIPELRVRDDPSDSKRGPFSLLDYVRTGLVKSEGDSTDPEDMVPLIEHQAYHRFYSSRFFRSPGL